MTDLRLPPDAIGGRPNCGLVAMAVVANVSLSDATEAYQKACKEITGRRMQGNWRGRTYDNIRNRAFKHLGVSLHRFPIHGMTLKKLIHCINIAPNDTTYLITTTQHIQVVRGYTVIDQGGPCHIDQYWGRRKRVRDVLIADTGDSNETK